MLRRRYCAWLAGVLLVVLLAAPGFAGNNQFAKSAIHLKAHGTSCSEGFPTFTGCNQIVTTYQSCGDFDAIPVFFELMEYKEVGIAIEWTQEWGSMVWVRCKGDGQIGSLVHPHDYARIYWNTCQHSWGVALGYGWLHATSAGHVATSSLIWPRVLDCAPPPFNGMDYACRGWSGVCGYIGDDPCVVSETEPSTWGTIKALFD